MEKPRAERLAPATLDKGVREWRTEDHVLLERRQPQGQLHSGENAKEARSVTWAVYKAFKSPWKPSSWARSSTFWLPSFLFFNDFCYGGCLACMYLFLFTMCMHFAFRDQKRALVGTELHHLGAGNRTWLREQQTALRLLSHPSRSVGSILDIVWGLDKLLPVVLPVL